MSLKILILGGAGFIGQHISRKLVNLGFSVRLLDNFNPQVHQTDQVPLDLEGHVELFRGDVRDRDLLRRALIGVEVILHLAAETGTGQSMYEIERYFSVNVQGTATLLDLLQNDKSFNHVKSLVVASSRSVYGEGSYHCVAHGLVFPNQRDRNFLSLGKFDPFCPHCFGELSLLPTPELAPFRPMSMYGLTKQIQEQAVLMFANTHGINGFGLRYQNVYGPGQCLKNPYTGILAVFSNLARQNQSIEIYEDGKESRDFVYIDDVVDATIRSINFNGQFVGSLNVGSGEAISVMTVASEIKAFFNSESIINVSGKFRMGDIRHNIADLSNIKIVLDFEPSVFFKEGVLNFLEWAKDQPIEDKTAYLKSVTELSARGLMGSHIHEKVIYPK